MVPKATNRNIIDLASTQQQYQYQQQQQQPKRPVLKSRSSKIETQTLAGEQSSIQDEVTQLKSVITKTIENNNENVKEVEQELEKIANERKEATERVISTGTFDTRNNNKNTNKNDDDNNDNIKNSNNENDFEPIVETFSEDDAIVIKPKQNIDEQRRSAVAAETPENDYVIEDNTIKNHGGKLATVDIENEEKLQQQQQHNQNSMKFGNTKQPNEPMAFTSSEFDDRNPNNNNNDNYNINSNKGFDGVTIGSETAKVRSLLSISSKQHQFWIVFVLFLSLIASQHHTIYINTHTHTQRHYLSIMFCFL